MPHEYFGLTGTRMTGEAALPNRPGVRGADNEVLGRVPRISKLLALAIKMRDQLRDGQVADFTAMAAIGHISKPRLSQILSRARQTHSPGGGVARVTTARGAAVGGGLAPDHPTGPRGAARAPWPPPIGRGADRFL